jgi:putative membrane protein
MITHTLSRLWLGALTGVLLLSTICSGASLMSADDRVSETDVLFVYDASLSNVAEVELARLARVMARSQAVRAFAEHMIADHTTAQQELVEIAMARGIDLPLHLRDIPEETPPPPARNDAAFDLTYMRGQVLAHQRALELFAAAAMKGKDQAIRKYAQSKIPALIEHLNQAYLIITGAPGAGAM